jgi:hypothetical protein
MVVLNIPAMKLEHKNTVRNQSLILGPAMRTFASK